ncbi:hypothetical protein [Synechococcus sp. PCC 7336]|uniref:hypothetical protein n=1 Tax=Synechococcus sp. PCC 7336 TaxID=195250 RepID=UPI00036733C4|nr:hypothetical protein [Synechococcus sp. PCC 7336]
MITENYFEDLHFTECNIGEFSFSDKDLYVNIDSGLYIFGEHPLKGIIQPSDSCIAIFKNVIYSHRILALYSEDRKGFTGEKIVDKNIAQPSEGQNYKRFSIEGVSKNPPAWLTWDIDAASFMLETISS